MISNALFLHLACCDVVMLEHCALHACLPAFPFGFLQFLSAYLCLTCDFTSWRNRVHVKSCAITVKRTGICSKLPKLKEAMSVLWQEQACSTSSKSLTLWPHKTVLSPISSFLPHWLERLRYKTIRLIKQTLFFHQPHLKCNSLWIQAAPAPENKLARRHKFHFYFPCYHQVYKCEIWFSHWVDLRLSSSSAIGSSVINLTFISSVIIRCNLSP